MNTRTFYGLMGLAQRLSTYSFTFNSEAELQRGLKDALRAESVEFVREARIGPCDRIDFLTADGLGIEVKVKGGAYEVAAQLARYLKHDELQGLLVVTTKRAHDALPRELCGKPVRVHVLARGIA